MSDAKTPAELGRALRKIAALMDEFGSLRSSDGAVQAAMREAADMLADQAPAEPVATLHDDGCFTWKRDEYRLKFDRQHAGWRMDVYAAHQPAAQPVRQPLTSEQIGFGYAGTGRNTGSAREWFDAGARYAERAHDITGEPAAPKLQPVVPPTPTPPTLYDETDVLPRDGGPR